MASQKDKRKVSVAGAVLLAAIVGLVIGAVMFHDAGTPMPSPDDVEFSDPYDDTWGKLDRPAPRWGGTHVLVSWTGASDRVTPKEPRTKEEARKLIERIWHKFKNDPTDENWKALQARYNEDSQPHNVYKLPGDSLVQPFQDTAKSTKEGFARICESEFGFHLIRTNKSQ